MSIKLVTPEELAEAFGLEDVAEVHRLRKRHHWPHVKLGRYEFRFTEAQVEQIIASRTVSGGLATKASDTGLTERSAARAS